jgi:LDH2 family malate/lactate/ureidoglycolate dehydrogenase
MHGQVLKAAGLSEADAQEMADTFFKSADANSDGKVCCGVLRCCCSAVWSCAEP